jgi:hypothetical protein
MLDERFIKPYVTAKAVGLIHFNGLQFGTGESSSVGTTQTADARFLRRIMMVLVLATLGSGAMAAVATVSAMSAQNAGTCSASGVFCRN